MSIRNNEERSGARATAEAPPPEMVSHNPSEASPLEFATPTEFVDLPSRGNFYPDDHPLKGRSSVEIRYMTAKDEDILTSKSLIKKGLAIDRLLENIIVDRTIKIDNLFIGDKNALIVAARVTGYGSDYTTKVSCPACTEIQEYSFNLEEHKLRGGGEATPKSVVLNNDGTWSVTCPKSGMVVSVRLLTGKDERLLLQGEQMRRKQKLTEAAATTNLRYMITSVNGNTDRKTIAHFINAMPAQDARFLRKTYDELMPNIDLTQHFDCQNCGFDMDMEVPFTTDFFWPK